MDDKEVKQLPKTSYQRIVYAIWEKVLKHKIFGIDDGFFEVGGTSLGAIEVISKINEMFELDIDDFFANPTIRNIADNLQENPEAMKKHFKEVLQFRNLKRINNEEWKNYELKYNKINDIQKNENQYQQILLLGATGFLGVYLLHEVLLQTKAQVVLIIRHKPNVELRLQDRFAYYFGTGTFEQYSDRIQIVKGDLVKENMGLSSQVYDALSQSIDVIINSAALVKHMGENNEFKSVNVDVVERIIKFAANGCKKSIHHMSTIGIAYGDQGKNDQTLFTEYDETINYPLNNQYLSSKYQAEQLILKARDKNIDGTIYRMNGILFDSENGKYQQNMVQSTAYIFYRALYKLGVIPKNIQRPMDISNVDKVSKAIICLMLSNQNENQIYHVFNPNSLMIEDILKMMRGNKLNVPLTEMSIDESYDYYLKADSLKKKYFQEIAFQCEIMGSIGKNELNICMEKTKFILERLKFKWNFIETDSIQKAIKQAKKEGFC